MKFEQVNWSDKNSVIKFIKEGEDYNKLPEGTVLDVVDESLRDDYDVVKAALEVDSHGLEFLYASDRLKNDKSLLLIAAKKDVYGALIEEGCINDTFRNDKDVILCYGSHSTDLAARVIGEKIEIDDDIAKIFAPKLSDAYAFGTVEERRRKEAISYILHQKLKQAMEKTIYKKDGEYISFETDGYEMIVPYTFVLEGKEYKKYLNVEQIRDYDSSEFVDFRDFSKLLIVKDFENAPEDVKNDPKKVKYIVRIDGMALQFVDEEIKKNSEVVKTAIRQNPMALQFASEEIKNNPSICYDALYSNINALQFVGEKLKNDKRFIDSILNLTHVFKATKSFNSFNEAIESAMNASDSLDQSDLREFLIDDMDDLDDLVDEYKREVSSQTYNPAYVGVCYNNDGKRVFNYTTSTGANSITIVEEIGEDGKVTYNAEYEVRSINPIDYSTSMKSFEDNDWQNDGKTYCDVKKSDGEYSLEVVDEKVVDLLKKFYEDRLKRPSEIRRRRGGLRVNEVGEDLGKIARKSDVMDVAETIRKDFREQNEQEKTGKDEQ